MDQQVLCFLPFLFPRQISVFHILAFNSVLTVVFLNSVLTVQYLKSLEPFLAKKKRKGAGPQGPRQAAAWGST